MATFQIQGNGNLDLFNGASPRCVTTKVIQGWGAAFLGGLITILGKSRSNPGAPWVPLAYRKRVLAGVAQIDETLQTAALGPGDFTVEVNSAGHDVRLVTASYTSGIMNIEENDYEG